ncbi:MAG: T9SS type A sorting domain-containing protein, partial [Bacteroidia bacterium]
NRYEVERSFDGLHFEYAGEVKAEGFSNASRTYSFTDNNVINSNTTIIYYRLKMIDNDEQFKFSPVVTVTIDKTNSGTVTVYPNPFTGSFDLKFNSSVDGKAIISMTDQVGRLIYSETITVQKGANAYRFSEPDGMKAGVYFVNVITGDKNYTSKVIKY